MHLETSVLRSYLEHELNTPDRAQTEQHLSICESCRQALSEMEATRARVKQALAPHEDIVPNAAGALARLRMRQAEMQEHRSIGFRWLRPVAATLAAVALIALALSVPAVRVWASSFLSLFRVQKVSVVQIDPASFRSLQKDFFNESMSPRLEQFFSDTVHVRKNGEQRTASTIEEAGRISGFGVRAPARAGKPSRIVVEPSTDVSFALDIPRLQALLEDAGHGEVRLPESADGQMVNAHIPSSVAMFFGNCPERAEESAEKEEHRHGWRQFPDCKIMVQLPGPSVAAPPDFDIVGLSSTLMQVLGMTPEQARTWSESIDWRTTLVVPIPRDPRMKIAEIEVDGVKGTLVTVPDRHGAPPAYNVVWVRDGILYNFLGQGKADDALQILNTM
jgi:hypothetical protein